MEFREQLMRLRKSRGWSQEELGSRVGVTRQTVSKWELGDTTPELEKLIALAELFDLSTDQLLGRQQAVRQEPRERFAYEYVSARKVRGIPLVHIHLGRGLCRAKGIVAVGNVAMGVVSLGGVSLGVVSLGGACLGLLALGGWAVGLLAALGGIALGLVAMGGIAVGCIAAGGLAVGVYALGGCAIASQVAAGGYARGTIAIGDVAVGEITFSRWSPEAQAEIRQAILQRFPQIWWPLVWLFSHVRGS